MTDQEKELVILGSKVKALHSRLDKLEAETSEKLKEIGKDIKDILAHQNRSKGWAAAFLLIGTIAGGTIMKLIFL